jgi:circadian clock protein KaiB
MSILKKSIRDKNADFMVTKRRKKYILRLFVSGLLHNSTSAIKNINQICSENLKGRYDLEIIDIYQKPSLAVSEQIIVIPVLIIKYPLPERRLIGDLSDYKKVLEVLNIN